MNPFPTLRPWRAGAQFAAGLTLTLATAFANATLITATANLDESQAAAGAGTGSAATGMASMVIDTVGLTLDISMEVTGIFLADITFPAGGLAFGVVGPVHIHNGPPGTNGAIVVPFPDFADYSATATGFALNATVSVTAGARDAILAGDGYINIHTLTFPAGEIRGQISVPEPGTLGLLGAGLLGLAWRRRRAA